MNITQALKKARTLLGTPKVEFYVDKTALTGDEREQALADWRTLRDEFEALKTARDERRAAILAADVEYQTIRAGCEAMSRKVDAARGIAWHRRVQVVRANSMFRCIEAEGDNFADAIDELQRKRTAT